MEKTNGKQDSFPIGVAPDAFQACDLVDIGMYRDKQVKIDLRQLPEEYARLVMSRQHMVNLKIPVGHNILQLSCNSEEQERSKTQKILAAAVVNMRQATVLDHLQKLQQNKKLKPRGRERKLSEDEEKMLTEQIVMASEQKMPFTPTDLASITEELTGKRVSVAFFSNKANSFINRNGLKLLNGTATPSPVEPLLPATAKAHAEHLRGQLGPDVPLSRVGSLAQLAFGPRRSASMLSKLRYMVPDTCDAALVLDDGFAATFTLFGLLLADGTRARPLVTWRKAQLSDELRAHMPDAEFVHSATSFLLPRALLALADLVRDEFNIAIFRAALRTHAPFEPLSSKRPAFLLVSTHGSTGGEFFFQELLQRHVVPVPVQPQFAPRLNPASTPAFHAGVAVPRKSREKLGLRPAEAFLLKTIRAYAAFPRRRVCDLFAQCGICAAAGAARAALAHIESACGTPSPAASPFPELQLGPPRDAATEAQRKRIDATREWVRWRESGGKKIPVTPCPTCGRILGAEEHFSAPPIFRVDSYSPPQGIPLPLAHISMDVIKEMRPDGANPATAPKQMAVADADLEIPIIAPKRAPEPLDTSRLRHE